MNLDLPALVALARHLRRRRAKNLSPLNHDTFIGNLHHHESKEIAREMIESKMGEKAAAITKLATGE